MHTKIVLSEKLKRGLHAVNQDVVCDMPADASRADIAEVCIDADRLAIWGHKDANEELKGLIRQHGYGAVLKEIERHVCQA